MLTKYTWGFKAAIGASITLKYDLKTMEPRPLTIKGGESFVAHVNRTLETALDMDGHTLGSETDPLAIDHFISVKLRQFRPYRAFPNPIPLIDRHQPPGFIY